MEELEIDPVVQTLTSRRYTARQVVEAASSTEDVLTNFLTKIKPVLCSESEGRGRARRFCLIDVYQFALWCALTRITRNANWSARALDYVLFVEVTFADMASMKISDENDRLTLFHKKRSKRERRAHIEYLRTQYCADITKAPPLYWTRYPTSLSQSWVILAKHRDIDIGQFKVDVVCPDDSYISLMGFGHTGVFLNATLFLGSVDKRLAQMMGPNGDISDE